MRIGFKASNKLDAEGNPAGGYVAGTGFTITWQDGPLGRIGTEERLEPNGAFVEDVIDAALQRIEHYQNASGARFACEENERAAQHLKAAVKALDARTRRRVEAKTEGMHEGS